MKKSKYGHYGDDNPTKRPEVAARISASRRKTGALARAARAAGYDVDENGKLVKVKQ